MKRFLGRMYRQRGAALIALAALVVLGMSWMLISAMSSASSRSVAIGHNARVLAEAKAALVAYVAANALEASEDNPGRLPCPQAWGDVGSTNEGRASGNCAATAAGWLPWRTLGLPQMLDASGRQLWYVVSPGWHLPAAGATLTINSNTAGQLSLDGRLAVALIIAPGSPLSIAPNTAQQAAGCTARNQSQVLAFPTAPNVLDFLDCQNGSTADNVFASSVVDNATNPVFNDQVLAITTDDLLPALEAAIAKRIERDIVPRLKGVYASSEWGLNSTNPVFPYATPFGHPGPGVGTSDYRGAATDLGGLLPFNQTQGCAEAPANPRCTTATTGVTAFLVFSKSSSDTSTGSGSIRTQSSCAWQSSVYVCTGQYNAPSISVTVRVNVTNVAMGLRALDTSKVTCTAADDAGGGIGIQTIPCTVTAPIQSDGSAIVTVTTNALPDIDGSGWGSYANYNIRIDRAAIGDHALVTDSDPPSTDPANCSSTPSPLCTGWFVRNEWYRLVYYATAPNHAASGTAPRSCNDTTPTCLQVANVTPTNKQRAILVLAGRSLTGTARPNGTFSDFLDSDENRDGDSAFEQLKVNKSFNDRVVVIDANP